MDARVVTVNDVLDGHVALDIQCLDRVYLNAYVPTLQTSAQVVLPDVERAHVSDTGIADRWVC